MMIVRGEKLCFRLLFLTIKTQTPGGPFDELEDLLIEEGFELSRATCNDLLISHLSDNDLLFLEIAQSDNLDFIEEIRLESFKPLILFGYDVPSSIWVEGLQNGADGFLPLPETTDVMRARVKALVKRLG